MNVRELIAELSEMPPDAEVCIDDADTSWLLAVMYVGVDSDGRCVIAGDYSNCLEQRATRV